MRDFYKPNEMADMDSDSDDLTAGPIINLRELESDDDIDAYLPIGYGLAGLQHESDDDFDVDVDTDSDSCTSDGIIAGTSRNEAPVESDTETKDDEELDEDDKVIQAFIEESNKPRSQPPEIKTEDLIVDLSFHPASDLLAVGSIIGDILLYKITNEENTLLNTFENHTKACRAVEFSNSGDVLFSVSKDKSIMLTDVKTGKLISNYENTHETSIYSLCVINENLIATGDDDGTVKVWDIRDKDKTPLLSLKEVDDYISCIKTNESEKHLVVTSGDGYLTGINIGSRKLFVQSEPYEEELTSMGLFRNDSKLIVSSSKGRLYTYNWGEFGIHSDMFPGPKGTINVMIPITQRTCIVAGEDGILRAVNVLPFKNLGVVGQHSMPVEALDISSTGEFVASSSHNNDIRFWNVTYFEDFDTKFATKHNQRDLSHNLPSSRQTNVSDFFSGLANE